MSTATANPIRSKFATARTELSRRMIERDTEIDLCLTALVAGEHVLFVGPPGTGKSMLSDAVCELIHGDKFTYLMTKYTDPSEVVGPVSLAQLKEGRYVRVTKGKLPEANIAFLDEIFKSSSAILNTMLKILNERTFDAGDGPKTVPLQLCVAASNEWPTGDGQQELGALFDRFVVRKNVRPIQTPAGLKRLRFDRATPAPLSVSITAAELEAARDESKALPWSDGAMECFDKIIGELGREGVHPGDRRQKKAVGVASAAAWLDGAVEVEPEHLSILADVLWDSPEEQPAKCREIVAKLANPAGFAINSLIVEVEQIITATDTKKMADVAKAAQKMSEVHKKLKTMKGPKAEQAIKYVEERVKQMKQAAIDAM